MRIISLCFVVSTLAACASEPTGSPAGADPVPLQSGDFRGKYVVPTVTDPALAQAAVFFVDHVEWSVAAGVVTLRYDLPLGLVGGTVDVRLSGSIEPGQTVVHVSGAAGTGVCTASGTAVSCREEFTNLGVLPVSIDVVAQRAAIEYAGPVDHRLQVASEFASDPIGVVEFDVEIPVSEPGEDI
jgi:hypothetical protein